MNDEILKAIVGALISGACSIVVEWIGKARASSERSERTSRLAYQIPPGHSRAWRVLLCVLIIWFLISPFVLGWKIAAINLFATIPITLLAAVAQPVRPATASASVLLLYSVHFLLVALWLATEGAVRDIPLNVGVILGFLLVNLFLCWAVSRARSRRYRVKASPGSVHRAMPHHVASSGGSGSLADEIAKLNELHQAGALTDDEFRSAKRRLLDA